MLVAFTVLIMLIVAYSHVREGLFSATCMLVNVLLAGLIAINFWEPLADAVEAMVQRSPMQGYEDFCVLMLLYAVALGALRALSHGINNRIVEFIPVVNQLGAGAVGLVTGYLISGFIICAMETLPWHQNFLGFEPFTETEAGFRRYIPPDRVWLAMMHRAGRENFSRGDDMTFDKEGNFESNYFRFRRHPDAGTEKKK
jgi:hypothetical protein